MKNILALEISLQLLLLLLHHLPFTQRCFNPPSSSTCSSSVFSACCCFSRRSPSPWLSSLKRRYVCDISGHAHTCMITATHLSPVFSSSRYPPQTSALFQSSIREGIKHYYDDLDFKNILDYVQQKVS